MRVVPKVLLALVWAAVVQGGVYNTPIKHVVVLMEENRSFDHMLGWYNKTKVNGLTGNEYNLYNLSDPNGPRVTVGKTAPYRAPFDPNHNTPPTTYKIYGEGSSPSMDGFAAYEYTVMKHADPSSVMNMFTPPALPIMSTLAEEFAVFDRLFCSHPGPTTPNRLFQLMGTSKGCTETGAYDRNSTTGLYPGKTIFDSFEEANHTWNFYYQDYPWEATVIEKLAFSPDHLKTWETFLTHAKEGTLPTFSFLNPRWLITGLIGSNDQHPDHDVRMGEALYKEVYEALRNGKAWNETLFVLTYDEHGGFYDHVPPPEGVPAPDDSTSFPDSFDFTRLGVRIPTLLVSPWIKKGTVIPKAQGPTPNSEYDLTSLLSTMKNMFGLGDHLSKRSAWAGTYDQYLMELTEPRTDCPTELPPAPKYLTPEEAAYEAALPINGLQKDITSFVSRFRGPNAPPVPPTQGEAGEWIAQMLQEILDGQNILGVKQTVRE
eukprot:TRINITY_DN1053_c0_g1_i4.p1 TRINITY_DN1053_c0_g1~~TRINITY_DN1053_c0_g1_i4.p1  ORF type:complete len:487 (+),score=169.97 TRINITY_DN1053_c0_g1_i4:205-1665(+)